MVIAGGVPAGAITPCHGRTLKPGTTSAIGGGTSGAKNALTTEGRRRPGYQMFTWRRRRHRRVHRGTSVCHAGQLATIGADPLQGHMDHHSAGLEQEQFDARCSDEPTPDDHRTSLPRLAFHVKR
ncbi:MAG: hypothetical protein IPM02_11750 [Betaproteobacteria bacterium]|nr:hypothetical protein [Betaproteobacteria bacterium]